MNLFHCESVPILSNVYCMFGNRATLGNFSSDNNLAEKEQKQLYFYKKILSIFTFPDKLYKVGL